MYEPSGFTLRPLFIVLLILICTGCFVLNAADSAQEWADGWSVFDTSGALLSPQFLFLPYYSSSVPYYVHGRLALKGFELLRLAVFSETDTVLEISINDNEQRSFRAVRRVRGQTVNILNFKPGDFLSDPAQLYRLKPLRPEDAGASLSIYDAGTADSLIPRRNRLIIHEMGIHRPEFPVHNGILRVRNELELKSPWEIRGDVIVEPGATLRIHNTDLRIEGRIISFDGNILFENSRIDFLQTHDREHGLTTNGKSRLSINSSTLVSVFPLDIRLTGESGLSIVNSSADGNFTYYAENTSSINIENCRNIGNIRYSNDSRVTLRRCDNVGIWLNGSADLRDTWSLPYFHRVRNWDGEGIFPVKIENCSSVSWGLRLFKGVGGRLVRGRLAGVELILRDGEEADFNGIRNNKAPPAELLQEAGYGISFGWRVKFGFWNFIAENDSSLVIRNSLFSSGEISGRDATMTIINSECTGDEGLLDVSLGSSCFIQHSTVNVPLSVSFGGVVRAFDTRLHSRGIVENGGLLVTRRVESGAPVEMLPGGRVNGSVVPLGTYTPVSAVAIPAPVVTHVELGGISTLLPRISGFEEYENTIVPHFEVEILKRFYVRFPEFEYVAHRMGSPYFSALSLHVSALFEGEEHIEAEEDAKSDVFYLPLAFETGLRGRFRLFGPFWGTAEIASDPSGKIYSGYRFYSEIAALREIPIFGMEARLYTGVQFADRGYIKDLYDPPESPSSGFIVEKFSYGGNISRSVGDNWLVSVGCQVEDYIGSAAESPIFSGNSFVWRTILALIYRIR